MLEVPLEIEEKSIQKTVDNNRPLQEKNFDNFENILRNSQTYEEVNEEPLSFREEINEDNSRDESLYGNQSTSNTREIISSPAMNNRNLSNTGRILSNVDLSQSSAMPKNEGSIKISLIGKIRVHGGFNQTPMLISFDSIPEGASATQSSVGLSNTIKAIETTAINLSLNDSNVESTFDFLSVSDRANETNDSLNTISDESQEVKKTKANEVAIKSREKLFDLTRRSEEGRKTAKKNPSRIEKRLDKYNVNSRSAKQIFLTDYSDEPSGKVNRTNE